MTFRTYEKETIRTADLKGDVVFVGLWATGSKNCTAMRMSPSSDWTSSSPCREFGSSPSAKTRSSNRGRNIYSIIPRR